MSNLTLPKNFPTAPLNNFYLNAESIQSTADKLGQNIYDRKCSSVDSLSPLIHDVEEVQKAYDALDALKAQSELLVAQARKVDTTGQSTLELQTAIKSKFDETSKTVMEKWVLPVLQDRATTLMFASNSLRRERHSQPYFFEKMKYEWKVLLRECKTAERTISTHQFPITESAMSALSLIPGTLKTTQDGMLELESFPEEMFVKLIDLVLSNSPSNSVEQEQRKTQINELLSRTNGKFIDRLDYFVYLFSPDPKGGDGWGKQHRFDRLDVFQKAFGSALWDHAKHTLPKSIGGVKQIDPQTIVFKQMHNWSQPKENDPVSKMFEQYKTRKATGALKINDKYTTIRPGMTAKPKQSPVPPTDYTVSLQPKELCQALYMKTGRRIFQEMFYGKVMPLDSSSWFTEEIREKPELEKIRNKLEVVCSQVDVELSVAQDYIRGCLDSLPQEDRFKIEEHVYFFSSDPWKGGERWGEYHAYDNPNVLLKAVKYRIAYNASVQSNV